MFLKNIITWPFKKYSNLSRIKKIIVVIIVIISGLFLYQILSPRDPNSDYVFATAKKDSITEIVSQSGNITTSGVTPVYSTTTGVIEEVFVNNGDLVEQDRVLFKVKSTATKQEQDSALATYMAAKNALQAAKAAQLSIQANMFGKWDTFKELAESDDYETDDGTPKYDQRNLPEFHIPEKEWQAAEAAYKNQQQVVSEKSVAANAAWQAYQATQDSQVEAILGGKIQNLSISRGDYIQASAPTNPSRPTPALMLVDDTIPTTIKLTINENDALKVNPNQLAKVEFDAIDNQTFNAKVERVDSIAVSNQDVVEYSVYIELMEEANRVKRGMTADVDITVAQKDNILTVPVSAVKPYQGGKAVRILNADGEIEFIPVQMGIRGNGKAEIISGLDEGTQIITALTSEQNNRSSGLF